MPPGAGTAARAASAVPVARSGPRCACTSVRQRLSAHGSCPAPPSTRSRSALRPRTESLPLSSARTAHAGRSASVRPQVVVAAGALRTPGILERSSIGHAALGRFLRIQPVSRDRRTLPGAHRDVAGHDAGGSIAGIRSAVHDRVGSCAPRDPRVGPAVDVGGGAPRADVGRAVLRSADRHHSRHRLGARDPAALGRRPGRLPPGGRRRGAAARGPRGDGADRGGRRGIRRAGAGRTPCAVGPAGRRGQLRISGLPRPVEPFRFQTPPRRGVLGPPAGDRANGRGCRHPRLRPARTGPVVGRRRQREPDDPRPVRGRRVPVPDGDRRQSDADRDAPRAPRGANGDRRGGRPSAG